ncbi:MAG: glycerophosphodiester phosphodiesterase [Deltaproteobacteria bacterium]|nr:glycerophosphodiester phosphodiesterase [Deltaproteobacteria bacterium]
MANPWLTRRVLNYAHQGGTLEAPSSTLYALHRALDVGATALELDVHQTRDGHLIVAHDTTVDRLTDGSGPICELELAQLLALDAAHRFAFEDKPNAFPFRGRGPKDAEFRMPTVDAVLEAFPKTFLNFDVKSGADNAPACARALARKLKPHADRVIVASFDDTLTDVVRDEVHELGTSIGTLGAMAVWQAVSEGAPFPELPHVALQLPSKFEGAEVITAELVARAHEAGLPVHAWTINDAAEMERLLTLDVDGLISDRPSVVAKVLEKSGKGYRR